MRHHKGRGKAVFVVERAAPQRVAHARYRGVTWATEIKGKRWWTEMRDIREVRSEPGEFHLESLRFLAVQEPRVTVKSNTSKHTHNVDTQLNFFLTQSLHCSTMAILNFKYDFLKMTFFCAMLLCFKTKWDAVYYKHTPPFKSLVLLAKAAFIW